MSYLTLTPFDINRENNTSILVAKVTMILSRRTAATNFSSLVPVSVFSSVATSSIQNISYFIQSTPLNTTQYDRQEKVVWVFSALSLKNEDVSNSKIFRLPIASMQGSRCRPAKLLQIDNCSEWNFIICTTFHSLPWQPAIISGNESFEHFCHITSFTACLMYSMQD